jgi:ankyrin repeat protein
VACRKNPPFELIRVLLDKCPKSAFVKNNMGGYYPIHTACSCRGIQPEVVQTLILHNPDAVKLTTTNDDCPGGTSGNTPLHCAISSSASVGVLKILLKAYPGAMSVLNSDGHTPFHLAMGRKPVPSLPTIQILLECVSFQHTNNNNHSNPLLMRDPSGLMPLHYVSSRNVTSEVTSLLLKSCPAAVNATNHVGSTPLALLCKTNARFLRLSVDPENSAINPRFYGEFWAKATLLLRAAYHGLVSSTNQPTASHPDPNTLHMSLMVPNCPSEFIHFILNVYPDQILERDHEGNLPLHTASLKGKKKTTKKHRKEHNEIISHLLTLYPAGAAEVNEHNELPLDVMIKSQRTWGAGIQQVVDAYPASLLTLSAATEDIRLLPNLLSLMAGKGRVPSSTSEKSPTVGGGSLDTMFEFLSERPDLFAGRPSVRRARRVRSKSHSFPNPKQQREKEKTPFVLRAKMFFRKHRSHSLEDSSPPHGTHV